MGSEMCIRDSSKATESDEAAAIPLLKILSLVGGRRAVTLTANACLLYTSDAADERSSVDLGGRRIIKKKKSRDDG